MSCYLQKKKKIKYDKVHFLNRDHDDESCVMDAVSRLNEVRGVRGLGRFFKQVCQSARQGSQDDFLGSINIPISVSIATNAYREEIQLNFDCTTGNSVDWPGGLV